MIATASSIRRGSTRARSGASSPLLAELERVTIDGLTPDLTLILDLDPRVGLARALAAGLPARARTASRARRSPSIAACARAYLAIAEAEPWRCSVLDATLAPEDLAQAAWAVVRERLPLNQDA